MPLWIVLISKTLLLINNLKHLSLATEETVRLYCLLFIRKHWTPCRANRSGSVTQNNVKPNKAFAAPSSRWKALKIVIFFNGCFEVKRIIISLQVLKFPRRNPTVLLVLRLLSFYTFDRLPAASITPKLMANEEESQREKLGWLQL